jgi:hypothetical protein
MKYQVKQINFSAEQHNHINSSKTYPDYYTKYLDTLQKPSKENVNDALTSYLYNHVADIEATSVEDAFRVSNLGVEDQITRHLSMHSLSVGDILIDENCVHTVIDRYGSFEL